MAARRLVMVLLVLLVVSTLTATLVPPPERGAEETTTETTAAAQAAVGKLVHETIATDAKRPERIRLGLDDALELRVTTRDFREIDIPSLGEFDEADRYAPAVFDLLPGEKGVYPVRVLGAKDRVIARIVVSGCCRTSGRSGDTSRSR